MDVHPLAIPLHGSVRKSWKVSEMISPRPFVGCHTYKAHAITSTDERPVLQIMLLPPRHLDRRRGQRVSRADGFACLATLTFTRRTENPLGYQQNSQTLYGGKAEYLPSHAKTGSIRILENRELEGDVLRYEMAMHTTKVDQLTPHLKIGLQRSRSSF